MTDLSNSGGVVLCFLVRHAANARSFCPAANSASTVFHKAWSFIFLPPLRSTDVAKRVPHVVNDNEGHDEVTKQLRGQRTFGKKKDPVPSGVFTNPPRNNAKPRKKKTMKKTSKPKDSMNTKTWLTLWNAPPDKSIALDRQNVSNVPSYCFSCSCIFHQPTGVNFPKLR